MLQPFQTTVIKETGKQFNIVKTWLRNNDVKEIIIATDAGREGNWLPGGLSRKQMSGNRCIGYGFPR